MDLVLAKKYADWLLANKDKKGTSEFENVANAFRAARGEYRAAPKEIVQEEKPQETPGLLAQAINLPKEITKGFVRGITVDPASGLSSLVYSGARAADPNLARFEETELGKKLASAQEYLAPSDSGFLTQTGSGVGNLLSYIPGGLLKGGLKALTLVGQAIGTGSEEARARASQAVSEGKTVDQNQQLKAQLIGGGIGLSELIPIERISAPVRAIFRGTKKSDVEKIAPDIISTIKRIAATSGEEGIQEGLSNLAQDLAQKGIYDPDLEIGQSALADASMGSVVGAIGQAAIEGLTRGRNKNIYAKFKKDEEDKKLNEKLQKLKKEQEEKDAVTRERLGVNSGLLALPAPQRKIEEDEAEKDVLTNPIGFIKSSELEDEILEKVNTERKSSGKSKLEKFSVEDLVDAGVPQQNIDSILAAKTGYTGETNLSPEDVMNVAAEKNIDTQTGGFSDFLARTTGSTSLENMSQPQLFSAFKSLSDMDKSESLRILPEGTNAKRFTEDQYEKSVNNIKKLFPDTGRLGAKSVIQEIKDFSGLENDKDAESLLNTAIKNGEFASIKKPIFHVADQNGNIRRSYLTRDSAAKAAIKEGLSVKDGLSFDIAMPDSVSDLDEVSAGLGLLKLLKEDIGLDIREGTFKEGTAPESFEVTTPDGKVVGSPQKDIDAAEAAADKFAEIRKSEAEKLTATAEKLKTNIDKNNASIDKMRALGVASETDLNKASAAVFAKNKKLDEEIKRLLSKAEVYSQPLVVAPKGEKDITRKGFTYFENGKPVATFDSRKQAEEALLAKSSEEDLGKIIEKAKRKGGATANRIISVAQKEIARRTGNAPAGIQVPYRGTKKAAEEKLASVGVFTPELRAKAKELSDKLRPIMDRLGLKDFRLNIEQAINSPAGEADGYYAQKIIGIAMSAKDPIRTVRHEAIHALKELGAFTEDQWRILTNKAKSEWIKKYNIDEKYKGLNAEEQIEEAIADAFSDFATRIQPGMIGALVNKVKKIFEALKNAMNDLGFQSYEDVFSDVEQGRLIFGKKEEADLGQIKKYPLTQGEEAVAPAPVKEAAAPTSTTPDYTPFDNLPGVTHLFKTARGSTYAQTETGQTVRNRSGEKHKDSTVGVQPASGKTIYLTESGVQTLGGVLQNVDIATQLVPAKGENVAQVVLTEDYGPKKKGDVLASAPYTVTPKEGLSPVEIWNSESPLGDDARGIHFGNKIIEVTPVKKATAIASDEKIPETEGEGKGIRYSLKNTIEVDGVSRSRLNSQGKPIKKDIKFSLRDQVPADIQSDIERTTSERKEEGFVERIAEAISPTGFVKFRQAFLNKYESIERLSKKIAEMFGDSELLASTSAISAALMSDRAAGIAAEAFKSGVPVYRNGFTSVSDYEGSVKGLISILEPLAEFNDPYIYRMFQYYAGAKRGGRLKAEGREKLFTDENTQQMAATLERQYPVFATVFNEYQKFNNGLVQYMKDTGVITERDADIWTSNWDYIPFYRQMGGEKTSGPRIFQSIIGVEKPKKLKGGEAPLDDFVETIVRNTRAAIESGMKNVAAQRVIRDVLRTGCVEVVSNNANGFDIVSVKEDGVEKRYRVDDPLLVEALKGLDMSEIPLLSFFAKPAELLRNLVTKDPGFIAANLLRDSLQAWVTSGTNIIPIVDTFKQFGNALADSTPEVRALKKSGLFTGYDFSGDIRASSEAFEKELRKATGTRTLSEKAALPISAIWDLLDKGSTASDLATRAEIYKRTLEETDNEAEAFYRALEVMNFSRKGNSGVIRVISALVPFFNARLQGLDILFRAGFGKKAMVNSKQHQKAFMTRSLYMIALSSMYYMMASDEEEYKNAEQETRDNNWIVGGIMIPIPFELGVLFKVMPERLLAYFLGNETGEDLKDSIVRNLSSTLGVNPIPQVGLPIIENVANYSFFRGQPIVGRGMEGLEPKYQYTPSTSLLAQKVGEEFNYSPLMVENLIRGYTGALGMYAVMAIDSMLSGQGQPIKASLRFEQLPVFKRFIASKDAAGTVGSYYDMKSEVDRVVRTINFLERTGEGEELRDYLSGTEGRLLAVSSYIKAIDKNMTELREMKKMIQVSNMSADKKRDIILSIIRAENRLTANIKNIKKIVYK